jgi:uncharacterized protein (TIGR04255 family)
MKSEGLKTVMLTKPINAHNAIEVVGFVVTFSRMLNEQELERIMGLKETLKNDLPIANQLQSINIVINDESKKTEQSATSTFSGLALQAKTTDDLNIGWELRIDGNSIRVTCREYDRWHNVWPKALKFIKECFVFLDSSNLAIEHFGCQIIDKFVYQENPEDAYSISDILNKDAEYLSDKLRTQKKQAWHINQGWFDDPFDKTYSRWLNQLTVMSGFVNDKLTTTINHIGQATFENPIPIAQVHAGKANTTTLIESTFDEFHKRNKLILDTLLSAVSKQQITLN